MSKEIISIIVLRVTVVTTVLLFSVSTLFGNEVEEKQTVTIHLMDGTLIKGTIISQSANQIKIQTSVGELTIDTGQVEKIEYARKSQRLVPNTFSTQKGQVSQARYGSFLLSLGMWSAGSASKGVGGGIDFIVPLPQEARRNPYLHLSAMPEVTLSKFTNFLGETNYLSSVALPLRVDYDMEENLFGYVAVGPMLNWEATKPIFVSPEDSVLYFGLGIRVGIETFLTNQHGINMGLTYYLEEGANRWDARIGYVFRSAGR